MMNYKLELIYEALVKFYKEHGCGIPSYILHQKISEQLGVTPQTAKRYIYSLYEYGKIKFRGFEVIPVIKGDDCE